MLIGVKRSAAENCEHKFFLKNLLNNRLIHLALFFVSFLVQNSNKSRSVFRLRLCACTRSRNRKKSRSRDNPVKSQQSTTTTISAIIERITLHCWPIQFVTVSVFASSTRVRGGKSTIDIADSKQISIQMNSRKGRQCSRSVADGLTGYALHAYWKLSSYQYRQMYDVNDATCTHDTRKHQHKMHASIDNNDVFDDNRSNHYEQLNSDTARIFESIDVWSLMVIIDSTTSIIDETTVANAFHVFD